MQSTSLRLPTRSFAAKISLAYATVGVLWIVGSGWLLHQLVHDQALEASIEMLKGWGYVTVTALLLGLTLDRYFRTIRESGQRLRESEERYRALFDQAVEGVMLMRADGTNIKVNAAFARMHGYDHSTEMESMALHDLDTPACAPLDAERVRRVANGEVLTFEVEHYRKDRSTFPLSVTASRVNLGEESYLLTFHRDITERKQAEAALRESLLFRREAEKIGHIGAWKVNPATDFLYWTEGVYEIIEAPLDYRPGLEEGLKSYDAESIPALRQALKTALQEGTPFVLEAGVTTMKGRHVWTEFRGLGRIEEGEDAYVMGTLQDVTERKRLEDQIRQSQKLEAIGQLAGGVAHDFNNLLTTILMQSTLEEARTDLPSEIVEAFQDIRQAAELGASLTRQLLLFSRRQIMQPHIVDLNDLVNNLAKLLRRIVGEDIQLKLDLHTAPLWLYADPGMLDQVVMNFTINARDAMPKGGSLTLTTDDVRLDADQARQYVDAIPGHYARLTVTDTGTGIPPEILPRIFEPFFTTKEVGKGTGLGLATVFGIVKQHRGWLNVQSTPGQGTTFRVHLPISPAPQPQNTVSAQTKTPGGSETILLVEDDPAVRSAAQATLQHQGYTVLVCDHGIAAQAVSRQYPDTIDLLLTDIVMPEGLYGRELAAQLVKERPGLKVIYMSGYNAELAGGELTLQTNQRFLQKPFRPNQLLALVRSCLDNGRIAERT